MMDKKKIERAAKEAAMKRCSHYDEEAVFVNGFADGAQWRINAAWHDAKDIPEPYKPILVVRDDGSHSVNMFPRNVKSLPASFKRWAYLDDLLPEEGKEGV